MFPHLRIVVVPLEKRGVFLNGHGRPVDEKTRDRQLFLVQRVGIRLPAELKIDAALAALLVLANQPALLNPRDEQQGLLKELQPREP